MATGKIVFLLVLVAICIAVFQVRLWMERRKSKEETAHYSKRTSKKSDTRLGIKKD